MDNEKKADEPEFEIIETAVGEGGEEIIPEPKEDDERLRQSDDDEDESESSANNEETPEQRSERRRNEKRQRRDRQRQHEARNKAEIQRLLEENQFLGSKMQQLEAVTFRNEARLVDERMMQAKNRYDYAERAHAEAVARGDGIGASKALRALNEASHEYNEADSIRGRMIEAVQAPPRRQQPRGPDPRVVSKAQAFIEKHPWIDPAGQKDEDSAVAKAIDVRLQMEGHNPTTDEYWDALEKRLQQRLPHKFKGGRQSPPVSGGMDRAGSGKRPFYLSPDRKKAMVDGGYWDDPVAKQRMIKRYAEHDALNKSKTTR